MKSCKLEGYFLIVWDIVRFCNLQGILVQGRGSAANSAVCYSLGITAVDPVGMELFFERFLSEERGEWPDIDLDLPSGDHRERAIQYVYERYGKLGAAMTANVITYRGRSAAREVGKVLGFDEPDTESLPASVQTWEWKDPNDSTEHVSFVRLVWIWNIRALRNSFNCISTVQDLPRHLGQHSGGMVICQGQLDSVVPLEPASMPGRVVVQWDKEDCADMGHHQSGFAWARHDGCPGGLIQLIRAILRGRDRPRPSATRRSVSLRSLQHADTIGMFQVESRAQMSCLPRNRPQKFYDLVVQVAIIRPGPYRRKDDASLHETPPGAGSGALCSSFPGTGLRTNSGCATFSGTAFAHGHDCANFTGGEAEELRRAFGFKRSEAE